MTLVLVFATASASAWFLLSATGRSGAQLKRVRTWGEPNERHRNLRRAARNVLAAAGARARRKRRAERIRAALPDALDLLAVGVTAGLSLDAAIAHLVDAGEGPLVDELARVLAEVRVGEGRDRALTRMAERVRAAEVTTLVRSLVQAEHLGVPLAETLHGQADDARRRRASDAEERAGKAPVKMLLPTAFFIFPALFVVVLAPAILELTRQL